MNFVSCSNHSEKETGATEAEINSFMLLQLHFHTHANTLTFIIVY